MKRLLLAFGALVIGVSLARAEPLSLEGAVDRALQVNVEYQNALLSVDRAANALTPWVNWRAVSLSATQKQTSGSSPANTTLGLNLPLFDQLGASASVDQDKNAQVSVTLNPLAHSDTGIQSQITYERAVLAASQARVSLETAVRKAYLAQGAAQAQAEVQTRKTALRETAYLDAKARYAKGTVTLAEVRTALQDWIQARTTQTSLEKGLVKARADLASRLLGEIEVAPLDVAGLEAAVKALGPVDEGIKGTSVTVKTQTLEAQAAQAKADALWWLDPGLSVSGNASVPAQGKLSWTGSVTLTLALGDWQGAEKSLALRAADLAQQSLEAQKAVARATEAQALLSVKAALDTVETRVLALAQAQELRTETALLAKSGEATALEVEDAELGLTSAKIDLFSAWSDLYGARLDLAAARS